MKDFIDKTPEQTGTPVNREALMAIQGFETKYITFNADGSIVERNVDGEAKTTTFNADGSITEKFVGYKTITKTTKFNNDGSISEVLS